VECTGDRRQWLAIDARALRGWVMIPTALAMGLDIGEITKEEFIEVIPRRHQIWDVEVWKFAANEVYIRHGHHSHGRGATKWASPFTVGQDGTVEECLILYTNHINSSRLTDEIGELVGTRLLSDTPKEMPCIADVLIAMVYYAWMGGSLRVPRDYASEAIAAYESGRGSAGSVIRDGPEQA